MIVAQVVINVKPMNIVVYGCGGVGGYFGARLQDVGHKVNFIARGNHLSAILKNGLFVKSINGNLHLNDISAGADFSDMPFPKIDLIVFATKTFQLNSAAESIRAWVSEETLLLPLLNGVNNHNILMDFFPKNQILAGLCRIISKIESPGVINHLDVNPSISFGPLDGKISTSHKTIAQAFVSAGIQIKLSKEVQKDIWTKFIFISSISALGALTGQPIGILRQGYLREIIVETAKEILHLANVKGAGLPASLIEKQLEIIDKQAYHTTASLQRDVLEGRYSELDSQNGTVVAMCKAEGLDCPNNEMIYELLRPKNDQLKPSNL